MVRTFEKPRDWQVFEDICQILFGEIWEARDRIKKHGRPGQQQNGVDVYCHRLESETGSSHLEGYWGIQCKNINEHFGKALTVQSILEEIGKAEKFEPQLKWLFIVTSYNKDSAIEKEIRMINIKRTQRKTFPVEIYFWDDIQDKLSYFKKAREIINDKFNYNAFKVNVSITGDDDSHILKTSMIRRVKSYLRNTDELPEDGSRFTLIDIDKAYGGLYRELLKMTPIGGYENFSFCTLKLNITNTGDMALENLHFDLTAEGNCEELSDGYPYYFSYASRLQHADKMSFWIKPIAIMNPLSEISYEFYLLPKLYEEGIDCKVKLLWSLKSKMFSLNGSVLLDILYEFIELKTALFVDNSTASDEISYFYDTDEHR